MMKQLLRSVKGQLIVLVIISLLPVLAIFLYTTLDRKNQVIKDAEKSALMIVRDVAFQQKQVAESTRQLLLTLTKIPDVRNRHVPGSNRLFGEIVKENPLYADIFATDAKGLIFSSGHKPFTPYSVSQRKFFKDMQRTSDFAVGEYIVGGITKRPVLPFAYPVLDTQGVITGIVVAGVDLRRYGQLFSNSGLPSDSELVLMDHRGIRLFTDLEHEKNVGKSEEPAIFERLRGDENEGTFATTGVDGTKYLHAYKRLHLRDGEPPYLYIRVSIKEKTALAGLRKIFLRNLSVFGLACGAALIAAWLFGSFIITRQVKRLEDTSKSLGLGNLKARTGMKYEEGELGRLAKAFDEMANKLEQKESDRKTAEEALKESEERYRTVIEYATDGVALVEDDEYIYINQKLAEIFGYTSAEEFIDHIHSITVHPDDLDMASAINMRSQMGKSAPAQYEFSSRKRDGSSVYIEVSSTPVNYKGAQVILAYMRDITEQKISEKLLKQAEDKYRGIFENALEGIFQTTPEGRFIAANPALAKIYGFESPQELLEAITDIENQLYVNPDDRKWLKEAFSQQGFVSNFAIHLYKKDGAKIWISMSAREVKDSEGRIVCYEGMVEDITQMKEMEEALRLSEAKYRGIFENAVEGIFQTTPEGRYLQVNPAHARMYGYESPDEMIQSVTDIGHQVYVDPATSKQLQQAVVNHGFVENFEAQQYRKDGSKIWTSSNARAVVGPDGNILHYEGTVENITDRKRLESQLFQSQKMEAIGTLAGGIAHDFNNILSALIGYCNLLQMKMDPHDPSKTYVERILVTSEKAVNLTQSLLAFSRKQVIKLQPQKVTGMVRGIEKILLRLLTEDIELKVNADQEITVMADRTQIDQVMLNLATNARDAMPKGGTLTIETGEALIDNEFKRSYGFGEPGRYAIISVSDTGSGMDEKTKQKIFEPFFTTKEVGKGTGLGLSIVYGIVKQHNGYINVISEPGKGTTFRIYLPVVKTILEDPGVVVFEAKGGTETILLAEDNTDLRRLLSEILSSKGYNIIEAVDGEIALQQFKENKDVISLLVLDVVMPKKNGKEVFDGAKKIKPDVKVLFTSGYTGDVVIDKGITDGSVEFIQKPLSPNELLQKIRDVLDAQPGKAEG